LKSREKKGKIRGQGRREEGEEARKGMKRRRIDGYGA